MAATSDRSGTGWTRFGNRSAARFAGRLRRATAFTSQPEPRTIGSFSRGRQLCAGNFMFTGVLVEAPGRSIWDLPMPDDVFERELHGFGWLDDLAAVADLRSRQLAQDWSHDWIRRYGSGSGVGWTPDITGRRLTRWINHAILLLNGQDRQTSRRFFRAMTRATVFLARRARIADPGLPRFEALGGLIAAGVGLQGMERYLPGALRALGRECTLRIDDGGGLPSRNPEELLAVLDLLTSVTDILNAAGHEPPDALRDAIRRIAPTLRVLRHADGGLARFHGGGRGAEGRLDQALAISGERHLRHNALSMGYARLSHGRTTVIVDAARPPRGEASLNAHASTLAFELTSGRRPLIVNCGSGDSFGPSWRRVGRATPSHSTLSIEGFSSSLLGGHGMFAGRRTEFLMETPSDVVCDRLEDTLGAGLRLSHDGYLHSHGLTHMRRLELASDGRSLIGDDSLAALGDDARALFVKALDRTGGRGVHFSIRFHLHPDVAAELDLGGTAVSMALQSGEIWIFRHDGVGELSLTPSVYLERGRLRPRPTRQIVLSGNAMIDGASIGWTLAKAQDTPTHMRDQAAERDLEATER